MKIAIFIILFSFSDFLCAQDLTAEQTNFKYMSTEGDIYVSCLVKRGPESHQFLVDCPEVNRNFSVHMLLNQFERGEETTFEFHYWVNEPSNGFKSNTQSTWLTVNKKADVLKIVSYVGLDNDANQLRVEINL